MPEPKTVAPSPEVQAAYDQIPSRTYQPDRIRFTPRPAVLGRHTMIDGSAVTDCGRLCDASLLLGVLRDACARGGCTIVHEMAHHFGPGATAIVMLAESHASIHTYPEHAAYMVDVFTCGEIDSLAIAMSIAQALGGRIEIHHVQRGRE